MAEFTIDGTDFGIDLAESTFSLDALDGATVVNAEIHGNQEQYDSITENEDSEWSWTLYPPHFYLRDFPADVDSATGNGSAQVAIDDLDEYEVAIYLMEHNDVDDVTVKIVPERSLEISGRVFLSGRPHDFTIKWNRD